MSYTARELTEIISADIRTLKNEITAQKTDDIDKIGSAERKAVYDEFISALVYTDENFDPNYEIGIAVFSIWNLANPIKRQLTVGTENDCSITVNGSRKFTAHSHYGEPTEASPDDILVYSSKKDEYLNFIINGYRCRKIMQNK